MKNFDQWNYKKKFLNKKEKYILPKKREIWWSSIGLNIGNEEDGKNNNFERPILIFKVFNNMIFIGIPITSINKKNQKFYFPVICNSKECFLILSQIRLFSTKRLLRKIGRISSNEFLEMKEILKKVLGLN